MDLIPDGAMFDERFRKSSVDDTHISLQVMPPSQRPRPLSFLNFHSTISLHKGRAKPDYLQMKHLLMRRHPQPTLQPSPFSNQRLVKDQVFPFTETRSLQAKVAMEKDLRNARGDSTAEKLLNLCWEGLDLPDFISGFSKQQEGGSYCVGIQEDKEKTGQRWLPVEGTEGLCQLLGMEMKLWKDKDNPNVLYLARDEHVPPYENRTGNYILRGVCLTRDEQLKFESLLTDRITSGMSLYPVPAVDSPPLVECLFHPVLELVDGQQIHKDLCVVEIRVRYFQGVCFQNAEGPEAYRYVRRLNPSRDPVRVSCDECCMNLIHSTLHL
ncbi:uncharacterized protein LOC143286554 [Babylonia areolata]|uniref:uncharacterized protein LOC143286554 n=1 Tax=Babylonia areolata TaxID=304850 RepID=UPI003FD6455B